MKATCFRRRIIAPLVILAAIAQNSRADDRFGYKDWELVCDNTRTCRAANHNGNSAMLLARKAGQHTPVIMEFEALGDDYLQPLNKIRMQVGDISVSDFYNYIANKERMKNLLEVMPDSEEMLFSVGDCHWTFSLAGLKAVLLKMDEVQGRIGTPGALIAKGTKPEKQVLLPVPIKTLVVPHIPPTTKQDRKLLDAVANFLDSKCEGKGIACKDSRRIERLNKDKLLVSQFDGIQGYPTVGIFVFIINDAPPYNPVPAVEGEKIISCEDNEVERVPEKGIIKSCGYGGGCWDTISWAWTGNAFEKANEETGCVPGGPAWELPRVISNVVNKNKKKKTKQ